MNFLDFFVYLGKPSIFFAVERVWKIIEGREAFAEEGLHMK